MSAGEAATGRRSDETAADAARLFAGPGELRARCRALDWAATPLGPVSGWPQSLRTAVALCLASGFPMLVMWGPELVQVYNDAFCSVLQAKHPAALGQRAGDCWPELWEKIGPMYQGVLETGASIFLEDQLFTPARRGGDTVEEAYFTFSYSAIPDEASRPAGILATTVETTRHVQARGEREAALERANAELRAAAVERERLLTQSEVARADAEQARAAAERTAAALAGSEARSRTVQDASPHGLVLLRPERDGDAAAGGAADAGDRGGIVDFRIQYVNPAGARLTGQPSPDAMVGHTLLELFPATRDLGLFDAYVQVMETGEPWEDDVRYVGDGLAAGYRLAAVRVAEGAAAELVLLYADATARLAAEAALRESEERHRTLFESIDEGFCVIEVLFAEGDPGDGAPPPRPVDYRFLEANPAFLHQTGLADAVGRTMRELAPAHEAHWFETYGRVALSGEPTRFEARAEALGRWYDVYAFRVGAPAERRVAILFKDVAERKRAEAERERLLAELGAERERLRALILQMPAPVALHLGPELRYALANDAYQRVSGAHRALAGRTPREVFPEVAATGVFDVFDRVYTTGEPWETPEVHLPFDRDGTGRIQDAWFNVRLEPVRDADGRVVGLLNFSLDVTAQVRARHQVERLLAEAEAARAGAERAALITNRVTTHLADGVCLMDAEGRLTYMNPAAERILGWTEAELLGDVLHDRVHYQHPDGRPFPIAECPLGQVLTEARPVLGQRDQWVRKGGAFVHVVTTCSPIVSEGRVVGAVLSLHDDTERRCAEAERERLLADAEAARTAAEEARSGAEAANRAKSEFLAVMSHELRTPLNAIGGYAELVELGIHGPVTEAQRTALARIQRSQRHLLGLIAGVLDYSRVEAGAVTYRIVDVPVTEAVAEAELLVAPQLRAKGLGYRWSGAAPELRVRADREKLQQILLNLLGNAVKFTDARDGVPGRIEVGCTVEDSGGDEAGGQRVRLHVRDTGEGIAADELQRIFEPFVQADQRLTRPHGGVGLGLAISRDLARGMGGDLTAESQIGVGSTFTLTLPAAS